MEKFAGCGIKNLIVITLFVWIMTVVTKTVLTKHPVKGVSEFIQAV